MYTSHCGAVVLPYLVKCCKVLSFGKSVKYLNVIGNKELSGKITEIYGKNEITEEE